MLDKKKPARLPYFFIRPKLYETDLTDSQWQVIQETLPDTRRRKYSLCLIVNALLYLTKSGCQWRLLPREFPSLPLVYYYFQRWQTDGLWARLNQALVRRHRQPATASAQPRRGHRVRA